MSGRRCRCGPRTSNVSFIGAKKYARLTPSAEQSAANSGYGSEMLGLMAEMGNGPMHMGRAVTLEGDADFDNVIIVYYPGVDYFAEMIQSEFFTGIVGGKQLGDTLSSPTVPLLPHL